MVRKTKKRETVRLSHLLEAGIVEEGMTVTYQYGGETHEGKIGARGVIEGKGGVVYVRPTAWTKSCLPEGTGTNPSGFHRIRVKEKNGKSLNELRDEYVAQRGSAPVVRGPSGQGYKGMATSLTSQLQAVQRDRDLYRSVLLVLAENPTSAHARAAAVAMLRDQPVRSRPIPPNFVAEPISPQHVHDIVLRARMKPSETT